MAPGEVAWVDIHGNEGDAILVEDDHGASIEPLAIRWGFRKIHEYTATGGTFGFEYSLLRMWFDAACNRLQPPASWRK